MAALRWNTKIISLFYAEPTTRRCFSMVASLLPSVQVEYPKNNQPWRSSSHHRDPAQAWRYPNCSISSSPNPVSNVLLPILVQLLKANARLGKLYVCLHTKINAKPRPKSKARQLMAGRISRVSTFMNIRASELLRIKFFGFFILED